MPDRIDMINFAIAVSGITISILGLTLTLYIRRMLPSVRHFFECVFTIIIVYAASDLISQISLVFLREGGSRLSKSAIFLESLSSSFLMPILAVYLLRLCGETLKCTYFRIVIVLWSVYAVFLTVTQFVPVFYLISDDNVYSRSPLYPVLLIPTALLMLCNMIGLYHRRDKMTSGKYRTFWIYLLIPTASILIQMCVYGILFIVLGISVSAFFMFVFIISEQVEDSIRQSIEIGEQQLKIRTLQMRPHFIYNTMTNIYYLCDLDPQKARRVVGDFTKYLRNNFSSIVKRGMIPFEDELAHTKAYLAVVEARYEDRLITEYDTPFTSFRLPPLTLEPIVENAVKHGLDPESPPLHIWIRTERTGEGTGIIVENSGEKNALKAEEKNTANDSEPHIGLSNVSDRLKALCGGTLSIEPRQAGGVIVTMYIPDRGKIAEEKKTAAGFITPNAEGSPRT